MARTEKIATTKMFFEKFVKECSSNGDKTEDALMNQFQWRIPKGWTLFYKWEKYAAISKVSSFLVRKFTKDLKPWKWNKDFLFFLQSWLLIWKRKFWFWWKCEEEDSTFRVFQSEFNFKTHFDGLTLPKS
jgi:hypothetical protein